MLEKKDMKTKMVDKRHWCPTSFLFVTFGIFCAILIVVGVSIYFVENKSEYGMKVVCFNNTCHYPNSSQHEIKYCNNVSDCLSEKQVCNVDSDCQNMGECIANRCKCKQYFIGELCEHAVPCQYICMNGASCKHTDGDIECLCPQEYSGHRCEKESVEEVSMNGTWFVHYQRVGTNSSNNTCARLKWTDMGMDWIYMEAGNVSEWKRESMHIVKPQRKIVVGQGEVWEMHTRLLHNASIPALMLRLDSVIQKRTAGGQRPSSIRNNTLEYILTQEINWQESNVPSGYISVNQTLCPDM